MLLLPGLLILTRVIMRIRGIHRAVATLRVIAYPPAPFRGKGEKFKRRVIPGSIAARNDPPLVYSLPFLLGKGELGRDRWQLALS
jgi:hypothetical protein